MITRIISIIALTVVTLFSIFGFLATFEPVDNQLPWRMAYITLFLTGAVGIIRQVSRREEA